ncbi:NAD-dependent epimerase/dehydratase family protein [Nocardia cyriacigeorgica]|uniref:NAD-dependent epimerase/dehydratase family protein n=1 Tax=Nocardia cyriacigeorgica TaxID=135487 RepID=A0A5R8NXX7_9NOCA|nr:NAD-dependent epimerase/dehydratase family protein [Nocardia cyriacigeorgica]TLF81185.1 NAD-dependent epimerase/dehydratase family protein [Nocardia cyriacigeorgica]
MRVLVTGATGFVGAWTAKAVHDHGHTLRLLVRDPARLAPIAAALNFDATDMVVGDMTDPERVRVALDGCDAVVHAAAMVALEPDAAEYMIEANLAGAKNTLGQAVACGIDPIVYVSSVTALWHRRCPLLHADLPPGGGRDGYARSKALVEQYARDLQQQGAPVTVTYPSAVLGPAAGDQFGESGEAVVAFIRSGIPGRGAAITIADVRDLAEAHARLLEPDRGPRRYVLGGHHVAGADLAAHLTTITGRPVRHYPIPDSVLVGLGTLADRFRHRLPPSMNKLGEAGIRYLIDAPPADNSPAERDLGITFRPVRQTLQDLLADRRRIRHTRAAKQR